MIHFLSDAPGRWHSQGSAHTHWASHRSVCNQADFGPNNYWSISTTTGLQTKVLQAGFKEVHDIDGEFFNAMLRHDFSLKLDTVRRYNKQMLLVLITDRFKIWQSEALKDWPAPTSTASSPRRHPPLHLRGEWRDNGGGEGEGRGRRTRDERTSSRGDKAKS